MHSSRPSQTTSLLHQPRDSISTSSSSSSLPTPVLPAGSFYVQALYAYSGADTASLSFRQGDVIEVLSTLESGWWDGVICEQQIRGWFPCNYVQKITEEEAAWARKQLENYWEGQEEEAREEQRRGSIASGGKGSDEDGRYRNEAGRRDQRLAESSSAARSRQDSSDEGRPSSSNAYESRRSQKSEDFWVPRVDSQGQVFYYNSETGESSREIPNETADDSGAEGDESDYPVDEEDDNARTASLFNNGTNLDWKALLTADGGAVFHENVRTGERTWTAPAVGKNNNRPYAGASFRTEELNFPETAHSRYSIGDASVLSGWTARAPETIGGSTLARRSSEAYSDDSELDGNFGLSRDVKTDEEVTPVKPVLQSESEKDSDATPSSPVDSLAPPSNPLLSDIHQLVTSSLRNLVSEVGIGGINHREGPRDFALERDRMASLSDSLVTAIRTLLLTSGTLEASSVSGALHNPETNSDGAPHSSTLSPAAHLALRPFTRQVTTGLSKLLMPIRAIWGSLETLPEDQTHPLVGEENLLDAEAKARLFSERATLEAGWSRSNETRVEMEARLRSQLLAEAMDLQGYLASFFEECANVLGEASALSNGGLSVERAQLRTPRPLQGSLIHSAALNLPGGGFGGNWRGNGFVTLPISTTSPNAKPNSRVPSTLPYTYPSVPLTASVAISLRVDAKGLIDSSQALQRFVESLSSNSPASSSKELLERSGILQQRIGSFLSTVENIDVAVSVDVESTSEPANVVADPQLVRYRKSVQEAKALIAELEKQKQNLYDVAPTLLFALQDLLTYPSSISSQKSGVVAGAQPLASSPMAHFKPPTRISTGPEGVLSTLSDLIFATESISATMTSLGNIADIQTIAPIGPKRISKAISTSKALPPIRPARADDPISRHIKNPSSSSRQSSRTDYEKSGHSSHDSAESDFFFSGNGTSSRSTSNTASGAMSARTRNSSKAHHFFGSVVPVNENSRGSISTNASSARSDSISQYPRKPSDASINGPTSPSKSPSSKKLAKLLGADAPEGQIIPKAKEPVPFWLLPDYGPDEVSFNMEGQVKGGTLKALVIAAASHEGRVDSNYLSALLMTYRTFCTSHQLLDILIQRFMPSPPAGLNESQLESWDKLKLRPIRARVANVIKSWVREHMDHDEYDPALLHRIADFATSTMKDPVQSPQILKGVEERLSGAAPRQAGNLAPGALPSPIVPRNTRKMKFTDIDPLELARQLTIMDGRLFSKITPQECLGKAWPKEYGTDAPHITAMIAMSNAVTRWVTETILAQDDLKKRANVIKHFIFVAERCYALNNFSTLIHIIAGLTSTPVNRLRRTWETVSQKSMTSLGLLTSVMRQDRNYKEYREALRGVAPPCVPFLGVYLTDWTFIGDGNSDFLREKPHQINFNKRQKASELILMIKLHQSMTYNLAAVPVLVAWLNEQLYPAVPVDPMKDDQRLYEMSLSREPRERDDEKIARLLSESGFL